MSGPLITAARGSDVAMTVRIPTTDNSPFDLTGWTVSIFEPNPRLAGAVTIVNIEPIEGKVTLKIEWVEKLPVATVHSVRLRLTSGTSDVAIPEITVGYY
jgi:hypothetical protein